MSTGQHFDIYNYDDTVSLYDTIVYNDDPEHGSVCFKTTLIGVHPSYRLKIYKNGILSFRPLGDEEIKYKLNNVDNNLILIIMDKD